jgi:nucleoside-diphosphate-sugar epimerase
MQVLLTGGTGFIGAATLTALTAAGHDVVAAVRSDEAGEKVRAGGARPLVGDITDREWFTEQLRGVDAAIHLATDNQGPAMDEAVVDAAIAAFGGSTKPFVHTGGIWVWGSNSAISEDSPLSPPRITAWRTGVESRLLGSDVKASVVAPAIVYGYGQGIAGSISGAPRDEDGALHLIGDGTQHWTTVHVDDLAELYVAVLEKAPGGQTYIGASGENPTVLELGQAVVGAEGSTVPESIEETNGRLGELFAEALLLDQSTDAAKSKRELGWTPSRPSLTEELRGA